MIGTIVNIFRIQDLRNKILFTMALLMIYRIGFHIPNPCFNQEQIAAAAANRDSESPLGRAAAYLQLFTGGNLRQSTIFGLGIMPYITASIILMLLGEVIPSLKKLRQEGQTGYKKIQEYTRYLTVLICVVQAMMYLRMMGGSEYIYPGMATQAIIMGVVGVGMLRPLPAGVWASTGASSTHAADSGRPAWSCRTGCRAGGWRAPGPGRRRPPG